MATGNPYPVTTVRIKPKQTALSNNNELVDTWLKTQPNPVEVHRQYDYEYIKKALQNHLTPGSVDDNQSATPGGIDSIDAPSTPNVTQKKTDFTLETAAASSKTIAMDFDALFSE